MRGNWNTVNEAIRSALDQVTLANLLDTGEIFPPKSVKEDPTQDDDAYQIT
jgi:DNA-binding IscR family transcriptional regulator